MTCEYSRPTACRSVGSSWRRPKPTSWATSGSGRSPRWQPGDVCLGVVIAVGHTLIGERIIGGAPALIKVGALVRSSHENFDGSGYPYRLKGEAIPLGSRIISVCDAFAAMTTDRPYRPTMTPAAAAAELRRCAGSQFDAQVVEQFLLTLGHLAAFPKEPNAADNRVDRRSRSLASVTPASFG